MICVTGSRGFIGSHLVNELVKDIHQEVLGADPRITGTDDTMALVHGYADKIKAIFHLGGISDTTCEDAAALETTNVQLPRRLADFCEHHGTSLIYASSASVYGNGQGPLNAYARSKSSFDQWIQRPGRAPLNWYGLRFFNVYGPGEGHKGKQASMVHQCIEQVKEKGASLIFYQGAARDFVHVDDVVSVMLWMWKNKPASGIYDVGTGVATQFNHMAAMIGPWGVIEMPKSLEGKYQTFTKADIRKLRAAGYDKPFLTLEEGIARMLK